MRIKPTSVIFALLLGICLSFCGVVTAQTIPPAVVELVAKTKAQIKTIDMAKFKAALDGNEDLGLIIDVREPAEFASGHIPTAINVPRGQIEIAIWTLVGFPQNTDMAKRMTLYCGAGIRCVLAAKSLQDLGFSNVIAVDMKISDWAKAGYPLVEE